MYDCRVAWFFFSFSFSLFVFVSSEFVKGSEEWMRKGE